MKIKALWGFSGKLGNIKTGQIVPDVEPEYAHALIGKGLAVEVKEEVKKSAPKENKAIKPKSNKKSK